jgi:ParB-like chromosome segregation protein Spo0J
MSASTTLEIVEQDPASIKPNLGNPRTHSKSQIRQIAASIREFGFLNPILIDHKDRVIAGHGRLEASQSLEMGSVPTVRVDHLSPAQIKAYVIADNKLALKAGWDDELLALDLEELASVFG